MKRSGAPGTPGTSAPSTSPAMRRSSVRAFVTRSALRAARSRTPAARTTAPESATKRSALIASATKASRSVKPLRPAGPLEIRVSRRGRGVPPAAPLAPHARTVVDGGTSARAKPQGVPRARAARRENSEIPAVEVRKRPFPAFDAVRAERLQRVAAAAGHVDVDVDVPPGVERHALQVAVRIPGARHGRPVGPVDQ